MKGGGAGANAAGTEMGFGRAGGRAVTHIRACEEITKTWPNALGRRVDGKKMITFWHIIAALSTLRSGKLTAHLSVLQY